MRLVPDSVPAFRGRSITPGQEEGVLSPDFPCSHPSPDGLSTGQLPATPPAAPVPSGCRLPRCLSREPGQSKRWAGQGPPAALDSPRPSGRHACRSQPAERSPQQPGPGPHDCNSPGNTRCLPPTPTAQCGPRALAGPGSRNTACLAPLSTVWPAGRPTSAMARPTPPASLPMPSVRSLSSTRGLGTPTPSPSRTHSPHLLSQRGPAVGGLGPGLRWLSGRQETFTCAPPRLPRAKQWAGRTSWRRLRGCRWER